MEIWKEVNEIPNYMISSYGRIKNKNGKVLKTHLDNTTPSGGYYNINLFNNGKKIKKRIHRLVAEAFLGKQNGLVVNHIDGNQKNNNVENLEWITQKDNIIHFNKNNKTKIKKKIISHKNILALYKSDVNQTLEEFVFKLLNQ
jgi:hypothetical protein